MSYLCHIKSFEKLMKFLLEEKDRKKILLRERTA
tara:strand:- start:78 stop:179 length:102 start_codon:yes stop_codon:yes gene_type:complete